MDKLVILQKLAEAFEAASKAYRLLDMGIYNTETGQHVDLENLRNIMKGSQSNVKAITALLSSVLDPLEQEVARDRKGL